MDYTYLDCLALFGVGGAHPGGLQLTKETIAKENINDSTAILEIGCGTGQTAAYLAQKFGCSISAVDANRIMVEKAQQRFESLNLSIDVKLGNTESLPHTEDSFDFVLSESVISFTHIPPTLSELKRVLKPNGVIIAIETVLEQRTPEEEWNHIKEFYGFPQLLTEKEWHQAFAEAGYQHVDILKYEPRIGQMDAQHAADFALSEHIDDALLEILEKHEEITKENKHILGYRIFRCS
ncbi:methyltransferase domain-containing protein [Terribacillus saccharophilus]|uniref:class I SAM-dependent methyltransferase n=1 Tax=Terribacillus saccharophilus TaxID=361277 RepID=UPI00398227EE